MFKLFIIGCLLLSSLNLLSQSSVTEENKKKAKEKCNTAIDLCDKGEFDQAIVLLQEAEKLHPESSIYPYERAYISYQKKEYSKAIDILERILGYADVEDRSYQLLGNCYDLSGNPQKAIEIYTEGIKKFNNSGRLCMEIGTMYLAQANTAQALRYYEKGIEIEPDFSSNYYRCAQLYFNSNTAVWGMIYAEIFLLLEPNSERVPVMSKLLYQNYQQRIQIISDTSKSARFSDDSVLVVGNNDDLSKMKLPYGRAVYGSTLLIAAAFEKEINLASLHRIRVSFNQLYYQMGFDKTYPNILFDYQRRVFEAGHGEAYNYWLLAGGDVQGFLDWRKEHQKEYDAYKEWKKRNPFLVDKEHKFFRFQY